MFQYKILYTISNNIEVYEESGPRTKKPSHNAVKFEAGEVNRILTRKIVLNVQGRTRDTKMSKDYVNLLLYS